MKKNPVYIILTILFALNILAWLAVLELSQTQYLEVTFFDVNQGDSIFIKTPKRHQILIDGGPGSTVLEKLAKEMPFWDRTIDLIILTHPEHDHISGLIEVLKRYKVENILWTGVIRDTAEYAEWSSSIEQERARIYIAKAGQKIDVTTGPDLVAERSGLVVYILHPLENLEGQEAKNSNNTSIIARLVFGENSFLFTGDAYKSVERKLIKSGVYLNSEVLKIGHHGSKTSSAKEFIEQVSPEIAAISVGKDNRYGHPHREVLEILQQYDAKILRTDIDGDIKLISNGTSLKIKNIKNTTQN